MSEEEEEKEYEKCENLLGPIYLHHLGFSVFKTTKLFNEAQMLVIRVSGGTCRDYLNAMESAKCSLCNYMSVKNRLQIEEDPEQGVEDLQEEIASFRTLKMDIKSFDHALSVDGKESISGIELDLCTDTIEMVKRFRPLIHSLLEMWMLEEWYQN